MDPARINTSRDFSARSVHIATWPIDWCIDASRVMAHSSKFKKGVSLLEFQPLYRTKQQGEAALERARWPDGFRCPPLQRS
jgi:hypothetical protein